MHERRLDEKPCLAATGTARFCQYKTKNFLKKCLRHLNPLAPIHGELGVSFCVVFLHNSLMSILQDIFGDHYEEMIYTLHPRQSVIENVDKMNLYAMQRTTSMSFKLVNCHHRHCVFTIDSQLRGVISITSTIPTSAMLSALPCSMKWNPKSALLSKRRRPAVTGNTKQVLCLCKVK